MNDDVFSPVEDEAPAAAEDEAPAAAEDEAPAAAEDEAPAAAEDEAPPPTEDEAPPPAEDEAPAAAEDEAPPPAEDEAPPPTEDEAPPPAEDEAPAAADDEAPPLAEDGDQLASGGGVGVGGGVVDLDSALGSLTAFLDTRERLSNPELELMGIETFALSPITSSSGLKGILLEVIGPYDNIVTQYRYQQNTSSNYTYVNEVTPDYPWIMSAALFVALVLSLFSLLKRSFSSWLR